MESSWQNVSRLAARFVQDEEPPKVYSSTRGRQAARIAVSSLTLVAFVAVAIVLLVFSAPSSRIDRHWPPSGRSGLQFTTEDIRIFEESDSRLCPCGTMATSWANYMGLYTVIQDPETRRIRKLNRLTDGEGFCKAMDNFNSSEGNRIGCGLLVNSVVNREIAQTWFPTAYVLLPRQLSESLRKKAEANLNEILWNYMISNPNTSNWQAQMHLHGLLSTTFDQFLRNYSSSPEDFWNAAQAAGMLNVLSSWQQASLAIEVDWVTYANACNPPYCDEVKQNSIWYRCLTILVQIGGLSTVVLLAVRVLLWPAMRKLFAWPVDRIDQEKSKQEQETKRDQDQDRDPQFQETRSLHSDSGYFSVIDLD